MRGNTTLGGFVGVRSHALIVSLLTIAALAMLQGLQSEAAPAHDFVPSAELDLALRTTSKSDDAVRVRVSDAYGKLPLHFEANRGQTDPQVKFLSRSPGHTLFLGATEAALVFTQREHAGKGEGQAPKGSS